MLNNLKNNSLVQYVFFAFILIFTPLHPSSALSAELLMLEQVGCFWCEKWDKEIGLIYPKTDEAKIAPLRKVNIHEPWPKDLEGINVGPFTPTFVVVNNGKEIGRMRGYAGDEFFWTLLDELLNKLPNSTNSNNPNQ